MHSGPSCITCCALFCFACVALSADSAPAEDSAPYEALDPVLVEIPRARQLWSIAAAVDDVSGEEYLVATSKGGSRAWLVVSRAAPRLVNEPGLDWVHDVHVTDTAIWVCGSTTNELLLFSMSRELPPDGNIESTSVYRFAIDEPVRGAQFARSGDWLFVLTAHLFRLAAVADDPLAQEHVVRDVKGQRLLLCPNHDDGVVIFDDTELLLYSVSLEELARVGVKHEPTDDDERALNIIQPWIANIREVRTWLCMRDGEASDHIMSTTWQLRASIVESDDGYVLELADVGREPTWRSAIGDLAVYSALVFTDGLVCVAYGSTIRVYECPD